MKVTNVSRSAKIRVNVQTFRDCALHQWNVRYELSYVSCYLIQNLKVALCTRTRTSYELKISIEATRLTCSEMKDELVITSATQLTKFLTSFIVISIHVSLEPMTGAAEFH